MIVYIELISSIKNKAVRGLMLTLNSPLSHSFAHGIKTGPLDNHPLYSYHKRTVAHDEDKIRFMIHSPCYFQPSEGPNTLVIMLVFDRKNYDMWEKVVHTALKAEDKLGFIDGTLAKPELREGQDFLEYQAWVMVDLMMWSKSSNLTSLITSKP